MISKKPKLAFYLPSLNGGGAERVNVNLVNELGKIGYSVDLVLAKYEGVYKSKLSPLVNVVDLKSSGVLNSFFRYVAYLRNEKPDVVISSLNYANIVTIVACRFTFNKIKTIVCEHTTFTESIARCGIIYRSVIGALVKFLYKKSDAIVAVSDGVSDDLSRYTGIGNDKIFRIYNPVISAEISNVDDLTHLGELKINFDIPTVISVGRLSRAKDYETLIRAFDLLTKKIDCQLLILGEGELRNELESLAISLGISEKVIMPGFVSNPYALMRKSSVFVLSSAWEGLPTVLIEAMACGCPIVSTNCKSGPDEILENGKWGMLVPVGDYISLCDAIFDTMECTNRPDVRVRARYFDLNKSVDEYISLISRVFITKD